MTNTIHHGHVELNGVSQGATLTLKPGAIQLDIAGSGDGTGLPQHLPLLCFTSNTGYFTLLNAYRQTMNTRFGVGSLARYKPRLAFESGVFENAAEISSRSWTMYIGDIAKILHVNGVVQQIMFSQGSDVSTQWTIMVPSTVDLSCPASALTLRLGQNIAMSGNPIDGPRLKLTYPVEILFDEAVDYVAALRMMHRVRQFFSMAMGRVLPITEASVRFDVNERPHDMPIYGILPTEACEKPKDRLLQTLSPELLATLLDRWLARYDELADAIRLHLNGLEQRTLPLELRFQTFVQALEALHRRTAPVAAAPIDKAPIVAALRERDVPKDVIDRVAGVLEHAHEPGLRQRLKHYWDLMAGELATLRPAETRKTFVGKVVATRNHYAHRTDAIDQVLAGAELWDATEMVKAMSHIALLLELNADVTGIGQTMLLRGFAEFTVADFPA